MSGKITDYLAVGLLVNRPAAPDAYPEILSLYYATDDGAGGTVYKWNPPVDPDPGSWSPLAGFPALPAIADPGLYGYDAATQTWIVIPPSGIEEAPEDGVEYVRKDAEWVESSGGGSASFPDLVGNAGKFLAVTGDESGVEWSVPAGSGGSATVPVEDEITIALQNGYVAFGSGYQSVKAIKTGRLVVITGLIKGAADTVAFTMPAGWRPAESVHGGNDMGGTFSNWDLFADGTCKPGVSAGSATYFSLQIIYEVPESDGSYADVGGGGGSGTPDIYALVRKGRADAYTTGFVNGVDITFVVESGDDVGIFQAIYTDSGSYVDGASYTVPAGKRAFLMEYVRTNQVQSNDTHYKQRLYNATTATQIVYGTDFFAGTVGGFTTPDSANNTLTFPVLAGVAGDVLKIQGRSSGDGNSRTVSGYMVLTLGDA